MKNLMIALLVLLMPALCFASMENHPGYFSPESLGLLVMDDIEIDINLSGAMLAMITGATKNSDPEFSEFSGQLEGIRVLVGTPQNKDLVLLRDELDKVEYHLQSAGWNRIVRVKEDDDRVLIFTKDNVDRIDGIMIVAVEDNDEIAIINIVGEINPANLAELISSLDGLGDVKFDIDSDD